MKGWDAQHVRDHMAKFEAKPLAVIHSQVGFRHVGVKVGKVDEMSKTERRYRFEVLDRRDDVARIVYEGMTFHMANGHRYCPDFIVFRKDGRIECVELKGSYRLGSYQRARLAFDQARVEFPEFIWIWAETS